LSSKSDQEYFKNKWNETRLIVMGSNTYNAEPIKPSSNHFFVVMTGHPSDYKGMETSGKLEFTNESPEKLFTRSQVHLQDLTNSKTLKKNEKSTLSKYNQ
jgi:dihydrofolate reductase